LATKKIQFQNFPPIFLPICKDPKACGRFKFSRQFARIPKRVAVSKFSANFLANFPANLQGSQSVEPVSNFPANSVLLGSFQLAKTVEDKMSQLACSSDLEVQERASVLLAFLKFVSKHLDKGDSLANDLVSIFSKCQFFNDCPGYDME
jgi:hypothetical protein